MNCISLQGVNKITTERALEIDITEKCNLQCIQCNRLLGLFPSNEEMSISEINNILNDSILLPHPFKQIRILGGEPILHSKFSTILILLKKYLDIVPDAKISIWSNGEGDYVKKQLKKLPSWIEIKISLKSSKYGGNQFDAFLAAPIDYDIDNSFCYSNGCNQIRPGKCGVGASKGGIYVCPIAAAIDKVLNFDIGIPEVRNISNELFRNQCNVLCRYCGHFTKDKGINLNINTISPFWRSIILGKNKGYLLNE